MSSGARPALVGRRFLSVTGSVTPKLKNLYDWDWRAGWIRSSTSSDPSDQELQVCVPVTVPPRICARLYQDVATKIFYHQKKNICLLYFYPAMNARTHMFATCTTKKYFLPKVNQIYIILLPEYSWNLKEFEI